MLSFNPHHSHGRRAALLRAPGEMEICPQASHPLCGVADMGRQAKLAVDLSNMTPRRRAYTQLLQCKIRGGAFTSK
jgi:hypothetical protein